MNRYLASTPFGPVWISFPDGEPNRYDGDPRAVEFLKDAMRNCTDKDGELVDPADVDPADCYYFCQPAGSGVTITPSAADAADYAREESQLALDGAYDRDTAVIARAVARVKRAPRFTP